MLSDEEIAASILEVLPEWIDEFWGAPMPGAGQVGAELIELYRGRLPDQLLDLWSEFGFAGFAQGGVWLTNPDDYRDHLSWWLNDTPVDGLDMYHVVARGPFGDLVVWAERSLKLFTITVPMGVFATSVVDLERENPTELDRVRAYRSFIGSYGPLAEETGTSRSLDHETPAGGWLFQQCLGQHGPLTSRNQVYGFAPYLFLGGALSVDSVEVVDEMVQLDLIQQFLDKPKFKDLSTFPG